MPDGTLSRVTWNSILKSIVIYELEELSPVGLDPPTDEIPIEGPSTGEVQDVGR